jgi:hypothetical protein
LCIQIVRGLIVLGFCFLLERNTKTPLDTLIWFDWRLVLFFVIGFRAYPVQWWLAARVLNSRRGTKCPVVWPLWRSKMKEITVESPGDNHHGQVLGTSGHMRMSLWTALPAGKESKLSMPFYLHLLTPTDDVYGSIALCFIASNTNFCLSLRPNHGPQLGWISDAHWSYLSCEPKEKKILWLKNYHIRKKSVFFLPSSSVTLMLCVCCAFCNFLYRSTGCTASLFTGRLAVCTLITGRQTVCLHTPPLTGSPSTGTWWSDYLSLDRFVQRILLWIHGFQWHFLLSVILVSRTLKIRRVIYYQPGKRCTCGVVFNQRGFLTWHCNRKRHAYGTKNS